MSVGNPISTDSVFQDAARKWLDAHRKYIKPRTARDYRQYIASLAHVFGGKRLCDISIEDVRCYQDMRSQKASARSWMVGNEQIYYF